MENSSAVTIHGSIVKPNIASNRSSKQVVFGGVYQKPNIT
jgi:hypothetical protein